MLDNEKAFFGPGYEDIEAGKKVRADIVATWLLDYFAVPFTQEEKNLMHDRYGFSATSDAETHFTDSQSATVVKFKHNNQVMFAVVDDEYDIAIVRDIADLNEHLYADNYDEDFTDYEKEGKDNPQ